MKHNGYQVVCELLRGVGGIAGAIKGGALGLAATGGNPLGAVAGAVGGRKLGQAAGTAAHRILNLPEKAVKAVIPG